jgi:hypothetical protein
VVGIVLGFEQNFATLPVIGMRSHQGRVRVRVRFRVRVIGMRAHQVLLQGLKLGHACVQPNNMPFGCPITDDAVINVSCSTLKGNIHMENYPTGDNVSATALDPYIWRGNSMTGGRQPLP